MIKKRFLSFILCLSVLGGCLPGNLVSAQTSPKKQRSVYLHAQQSESITQTVHSSTVYKDEQFELHFAIDDPNKGEYLNGVHTEKQYDLNGYRIAIYFDPDYLAYAPGTNSSCPIDYTVKGSSLDTSGSVGEEVGGDVIEAPSEPGYYVYPNGTGSTTEYIGEKKYEKAYITVFYSGGFLPQKKDGETWYNLCSLPLVPIKAGSTQVFFDTTGGDDSLELFAKNTSEELADQTFEYSAENGGYHTIVIKNRNTPNAPTAVPGSGSYTQTQHVTLHADSDCDIYYSVNGEEFHIYDGNPIDIETTSVIECYAQRIKDPSKQSRTVSFEYKILPKKPLLFADSDGKKVLITPVYYENSAFSVYACDSEEYGSIDKESEIYYTFTDISEDDVLNNLSYDPEESWVKLSKATQEIEIEHLTTVRLITQKNEEFSAVSEYTLGIRPAPVTAEPDSCKFKQKIDVELFTKTKGAQIYYTTDGSDPTVKGLLYNGMLTFASDTTIRAAAKYDGVFSEINSFYYIMTEPDDFGVDAFYPSGVYSGSVYVTLTPKDPENDIKYSTDDGKTWNTFTKTLLIESDTKILAKAGKADEDVWGDEYKFTYVIRPYPPEFYPETTQFTSAGIVSIYCIESDDDTTEHFELYYTTDGSDPTDSKNKNRVKADDTLDSAEITIAEYTVIKAVVLKDGKTYSDVVTHTYDIVSKKPPKPVTTLAPGSYTRKIGSEKGFETQFMPVAGDTKIYYTVNYSGSFEPDPVPSPDSLYEEKAFIEIKGHTIIKAIAVNSLGISSDVGIFEYTVMPEAPIASPSATIGGSRLPIVPVSSVKGSTVKYEINGFKNEFLCENGNFYIDTQTGSAYLDENCTLPLGKENSDSLSAPAKLTIRSVLDGVDSFDNYYVYDLSKNDSTLAPPYADKATGEYEEISIDNDDYLLCINLYSLNDGDTIEYKFSNLSNWTEYDGNGIRIKNDTVLQIRSEKNGKYSRAVSYVYNFIPLAPIITLSSGRYLKADNPETTIEYDSRAPKDKIKKDYQILYRENGEDRDYPYTLGTERKITHTMSFKAYVKNESTGRLSKNTITYYIIEDDNPAGGIVYVANPYDTARISAHLLDDGDYAKGIALLTSGVSGKDTEIRYNYSYTIKNSKTPVSSATMTYENTPITVNPSMTGITINAWLENSNGKIDGSDVKFPHDIEFVHLEIPQTSLGTSKVEYPKNTKYTILNDYPNDTNIFIYYTANGSDPTDEDNSKRRLYDGEQLSLTSAVTVKTAYYSACGTCKNCKNEDKTHCLCGVYGEIGTYSYTVPTVINGGGGGGGSSSGGGTTVIDKTRKYTKDIFGNEHPTHISYINGYPDGSVQPDGAITREEMTAILYRITNHEYEKPFAYTGDVFPDVKADRWSVLDIEYMADKSVVLGYPDGEFKPSNNLTRAEFAALICRFAQLKNVSSQCPFPDVDSSHWAYDSIASLAVSGFMQGYEDGTYRPENSITRAEVMTVINKLLGRNPSDTYVKSLSFNPYTDLSKDKWYYTAVLEATITHNYYLNDSGVEYKWEDCK